MQYGKTAREDDRENVRALCRFAYMVSVGTVLPDDVARASVTYDPGADGLSWRLDGADGAALREGNAWPELLDLMAETADLVPDELILV